MEKLVLTNTMISTVKQSLIDGLTVASGSRSSATYYHSRDEQLKAIRNQVMAMYRISKEIPLFVATQRGVTGRFISEVLLNEFRNTSRGGACNIVNPIDWYDNGIGDKALLIALENLYDDNGLPYVLRFFMDLKKMRVNNERSRKITLGFIWGQSNIEFYSLKYRNKIAETLKHVYGVKKTSILLSIASKHKNMTDTFVGTEKELSIINDSILKYFNGEMSRAFKLLLFLFKKDDNVIYDADEFPLFNEYQIAKTNILDVKRVPEEVLHGLISDKKHPQYNELWSDADKRESTKAIIRKNVEVTSINQQVRQTKSTAKLGVERVVELDKATDFMALYKTGFETKFTRELSIAIDKLAEKKKINGFYYQNIGVIVDDSASMKGHKVESKNTPRAIVDFTRKVLEKSTKNCTVRITNNDVTDLGSSFIDLLKNENSNQPYDAIFILSDGYENSYDGLTDEIISIYQKETGSSIPIFQISPITSAEMGANVRKISERVVTMAINNPVALQPQINARLLEIDTKRWLVAQMGVLKESNVSRTKKIINS